MQRWCPTQRASTHSELLCLLCHARLLLHGCIGVLLWAPDRAANWGEVLGVHGKLALPAAPAKLQRVGSGVDGAQAVGGLLQAEVGGYGRSLQHAQVACRNARAHLGCGCVAEAVDREAWVAGQRTRCLLTILFKEGCM